MTTILVSKLIELFNLPSCASTVLQTSDTNEYLNLNRHLALLEFDYLCGVLGEVERQMVDQAVARAGYESDRRREIAELLVMQFARQEETMH